MTAARRYLPNYTARDYAQWEGDWELWDGVPVSMAPSPFGPHNSAAARLSFQLQLGLEASHCDAEVLPETDWIVSDQTVVRPDVSVVCGDVPPRHIESPPALVAEVLSDATRLRDLNVKRDLYRDEGVTHYLILDPDTSELTWWRIDSGGWRGDQMGEAFELVLCVDCRVQIEPGRLFR